MEISETSGMMLTEDGGPQLPIQLVSGEANALNPSAKWKAFQRNKGYGSPLGDQDFSKNIVVQPGMLSSFGLLGSCWPAAPPSPLPPPPPLHPPLPSWDSLSVVL